MLRKNMIRILAIAAFCSLPYSFVANVNTANAAELQDKITSNLNLSASGNASFSNRVGTSFLPVGYHYAVYTGANNALVAMTAEIPDDHYWINSPYVFESQNDPFANILPSNNWKTKRFEKLSGNKLVILEYREADTNQDASTFENNANKAANMINYPVGLNSKPKGQKLDSSKLADYLPQILQKPTV